MPLFLPPMVEDTPWVNTETPPLARRLFRHYGAIPRGRSVVKIAGQYLTVDTPDQLTLNLATEVYLGGHEYEVTDAVYAALVADGVVTNLLTADQSSFETSVAGWSYAINCTPTRSVAQARTGTASMAITCNGGGTPGVLSSNHVVAGPNAVAVSPSAPHTAIGWLRAATTARSFHVAIWYYTAAGDYITHNQGDSATDSTAGWTAASVTFTSPATAAYAGVGLTILGTPANGEVHHLDDVVLVRSA